MAKPVALPSDVIREIEAHARALGAEAVSCALHPVGSGERVAYQGDQMEHAASTMKIAVLVSVVRAVDRGEATLDDVLHVRNRFESAIAGTYSIAPERGANARIHEAIGRTLPIRTLAQAMITTSSNLATNVLLAWLTPARVQADLAEIGVRDVEVVRGVGDEAAWAAGLSNRASANGLADLLVRIERGEVAGPEGTAFIRETLAAQEYRAGIPAGLKNKKVGNKTGDISTVVHDAALVWPEGEDPYALVVMSRWPGFRKGRYGLLERITRTLDEKAALPARRC